MIVRSLILVAVAGALFFGRMRESHAITTCNVCADGVHPCSFRCYTGSPPFPFVTTCGGAGYHCLHLPFATSGEACDAPAPPSEIAALVALAADWLRDGLALMTSVAERVAALDGEPRIATARS